MNTPKGENYAKKGENWEKTTALIPGFHPWYFVPGLTAKLPRAEGASSLFGNFANN